jgi:hypothetical protein
MTKARFTEEFKEEAIKQVLKKHCSEAENNPK